MSERRVQLYLFFLMAVSMMLVGFNQPLLYGLNSDEGYYKAYAAIFSKEGFSSFAPLLKLYWSNPTAQYFPPPTRLGYIIPLGFLYPFWPSIHLLVFFSFCCYAASLGISLHFAKKLLDKTVAYALTALLAASPVLMGISRRALIDSLLFLCWTSILWLCSDYVINKNRKQLAGICLILAYALTIKESTVVLMPFIAICCWLAKEEGKSWPWKEWLMVAGAFVVGFLIVPGIIVGFPLWIKSMWQLLCLQKSVFAANPYVERYCQGPWFRYLVDALLLSPIVTLLAFGFTGFLLFQKNNLRLPLLWLTFFVTVYTPLVFLQKNIRYALSLEVVYCLFAAMAFYYFIEKFSNPDTKNKIWIVGIFFVVAINWRIFHHIFIQHGLLDPISFHLLSIEKFIP